MKHYFYFVLIAINSFVINAQVIVESSSTISHNSITDSLSIEDNVDSYMSLAEYLGYIKKFHPIVKQANLIVDQSDLKLLKSRGVFDPKLELDYETKEFKSQEYYNKINTTFKVPIWYGVGVKANYENNDGYYLNPENTTPDDGLYSLGLTASIGNGMFMNTRMAAVKQSKNFQKQAIEERKILVNKILYDAANSYFDWLQYYKEKELHRSFLKNAKDRFLAVKRSYLEGEYAAVDTLEANITVNNRKLNLEKASINYIKSTLELSNFLWLENNIPVELSATIVPDTLTIAKVDSALQTPALNIETYNIEEHPKLKALGYKLDNLEIDRKLNFNKLLPKIDAQYNFISESIGSNSNYGFNNYKAGVKFSMPIFLRKERADLKLSKLKIEALDYEKTTQAISINNKIKGIQQELFSYEKQIAFTDVLVKDYHSLSLAEQRKFVMGESSVFYVNIRESKLLDIELKAIQLMNLYLKTKAKLFNSLVVY